MRIEFHTVKRGKGERYGARKYGRIESETVSGLWYDISKVRVKNKKCYAYKCSCGDFIFRNNSRCKHILLFLKEELRCRNDN